MTNRSNIIFNYINKQTKIMDTQIAENKNKIKCFVLDVLSDPRKLATWLLTFALFIIDVMFKVEQPWRSYLSGITYSLLIYSFWNTVNYQIKTWMQSLVEMLVKVVVGGVKEVKEQVVELGTDISGGISFTKIAKNFNNHKVGIALCTKDITSAQSAVEVAGEIGKIGSMLGLETNISQYIVSGVANLIREPEIEMRSIDEMLPAVGTMLTLMGKEVGDIDISNFITQNANNTKNIKILVDNATKALEGMGLVKGNNYELLKDLNAKVLKMKEELEWLHTKVAVQGVDLCTPKGKERVNKFKEDLKHVQTILHTTQNTTLKNNAVYTTCQQINVKASELLIMVEKLQSQKERVKPVGVCIFGETNIGKTMISNILISKVKKRIIDRNLIRLGDVQNWQTWNAQFRDEYDSGYAGHEVVYMDDAFQQKSCEDHLMWYSFISTSPIGMVMADSMEKGKPFNGKLVVTSCNVLPTKSITVNDISALHTRFPFTIYAEKVSPIPQKLDPDFKHLKFKMGPMKDMIDLNDLKSRKTFTLEGIVDAIVDQLHSNHLLWEQIMQIDLREVEQRVDSDDEDVIEEELIMFDPEEDGEVIYETPGAVWTDDEIRGRVEIEEEVEEPIEEEWIPLNERMDPTVVTTGELEEWNRVNREIINSFLNALDGEAIQTPLQLGNWITHLRRHHDGTSAVEIIRTEGMTPFEFLLSLNQFSMPQTPEFEQALAEVGFVVVEYMDNYMWSPLMFKGKKLILISEELKKIVAEQLLPRWKRWIIKGRQSVLNFWEDPRNRLLVVRFTVGSIYLGLAPDAFMRLPAHMMMTNYVVAIPRLIPMAPLNRRIYQWCIWQERLWNKWFNYLTMSMDWLRNTVNEAVLGVLTTLGVDIGEYMQENLALIGDTVVQSIILFVSSILVYAIYKLITCMFSTKKVDTIEERSPRDKTRPSKKFTIRSKKVEMRMDGLDDNDCTLDEVVHETENWTFVHADKDKDTFYEGEIISVLENLAEDVSEKTFRGIVKKRKEACYMINIIESEEEIIRGKTELKSYRMLNTEPKTLNIKINLTGNFDEILTQYLSMIGRYKGLQIKDYICNFLVSGHNQDYFVILDMHCLNRMQGGNVCAFTRKMVNDFTQEREDLNGTRNRTDLKPEQIVLRSTSEAISAYNMIKHKHYVLVSKTLQTEFDSEKAGSRSYGVGSDNYIYVQEHLAQKNDIVRFWRCSNWDMSYGNYNLARIVYSNVLNDLSIGRILTRSEALIYCQREAKLHRMSAETVRFPSLKHHLYSREEYDIIAKQCEVLVHLPKTQLDVIGQATKIGSKTMKLTTGEMKLTNYLMISRTASTGDVAQRGDCGGLVMNLSDRYTTKLMGLYAAGGDNWYATMLTTNDLIIEEVIETRNGEDPWEKLILKGEPKDMPDGPGATFVGRFIRNCPPVSKSTLSHWHQSPWSDLFEEQLEPSPLDARDDRITSPVKVNQEGQPSLLMEQNSKMCQYLPNIDKSILEIIEEQFVNEMSTKMYGVLKETPTNIDNLLHMALNGQRNNIFVTNMTTNKSAGLPWTMTGNVKKSNYLNVHPITGEVSFKEDDLGRNLRDRVVYKLNEAKKGNRVLSFSNSKVKDALVKKKCVPIAKVRVYHCISVDKIIADSALFGNFKETFTRGYVTMNHAVGTDPHSTAWGVIGNHMLQHPNYFDVDFENYDKYLHKELMESVFNIMRRVIQNCAPDPWDNAREVLMRESIETYVVDYDTVYKTDRGNKSGEFLTTIVNCIANDILSFYAWIKTVKNTDIQEFRENVNIVSFGDDKIESVSDKYAPLYNYMTVKQALEEIGHRITPGSKDGVEQPFTDFENLQFLKRSFKILDGKIIAPLLIRSLEAPFTWTQILESEVEIWVELVKQQVDEALLISPEYYASFCGKIRQCNVPTLQLALAPIVSRNYEAAKAAYFKRYFKYE